MQRAERKPGRRVQRTLAFALALVSIVFLLQVTPHGHVKGHDEAACRLCQTAHVSATPTVSGIVLSVPLVPFGEVTVVGVVSLTESFSSHADTRAPPAAVLS
jgi:hypothetical protein